MPIKLSEPKRPIDFVSIEAFFKRKDIGTGLKWHEDRKIPVVTCTRCPLKLKLKVVDLNVDF